MSGKIFINYRRDDERAVAGRIRDRLAQTFGEASLFMDVDNLLAGQRFDRELEKVLAETEVFLALIGPRWMELLKQRQASSERDYVREEIARTLKRDITIIPVLIENASLPRGDELPEDIRELVLHHKHDVTHEHFGQNITALTEAVKFARRSTRRSSKGLVFAALSVAAVTGGLAVLYSGVPVPWSSFVQQPSAADTTAAKAKADVDERQSQAAAKARAEMDERQRQVAAEIDRERQARVLAEAESRRLAAVAEQAQKELEARNRAAEIERERQARIAAEAEQRRLASIAEQAQKELEARKKAEAEAKRKEEEAKAAKQQVLAATTSNFGPPAPASSEKYRVNGFTYRTPPQEIDPGLRVFRRHADGTWTNSYPSGHVDRANERARIVLDGCTGTVIGEQAFAVFIADKNCPGMMLRFRRDAGQWVVFGHMENVQ